jgi:protein TonB
VDAESATPDLPPEEPPPLPVRRARLRLREGWAPVSDRLLATVFLAALLHGIIIIGLTFGTAGRGNGSAPGLDVLLVSDEVPTADRNDTAAYLSQRTQLGGGTSPDVHSANSPAAADARVSTSGDDEARESTDEAGNAVTASDETLVATTATRTLVRFFNEFGAAARGRAGASEDIQLATRNMGHDPDDDVRLRGAKRDELLLTPDTRESSVAPYLDAWRRKVERLGTLNFPAAARHRALAVNPILEVTMGASGGLVSATIQRSSGYADLDQAAVRILKLASPFDPFPRALATRYRTLRFAYEWQFVGGGPSEGPVTAPPSPR